jgi:uroporphyrinogen-III synthase
MHKFSAGKTYALFSSPMNLKVISEMETAGAQAILFPAVETREVFEAEQNDLTATIKSYDWLVFTDIYTVEFFLQQLEKEAFDFFELDEIRVCAYGESVADRLRFAQLHADIIPNSIKTSEVVQTIKDYFMDEDELKSARFLILKEKNTVPEISKELENLGAEVSEISIYETVAEKPAEMAKLKSLLVGGAIDEFVFTSPFDAINLAHLFPNENLENVLADVKLSAGDKQTRQSLDEFRLI